MRPRMQSLFRYQIESGESTRVDNEEIEMTHAVISTIRISCMSLIWGKFRVPFSEATNWLDHFVWRQDGRRPE